MSATTENAPVYNVIQQQIQMTPRNSQSTKSAPQMMEGNQQSNNSNLLIAIMNEDANSTHNTMSMSLQNYLFECAAKNTCAKGL